jgi:hypothetical protein
MDAIPKKLSDLYIRTKAKPAASPTSCARARMGCFGGSIHLDGCRCLQVMLVLIFLKYVSDACEERQKELRGVPATT